MKKCGIYSIRNKTNNKIYIGSSQDIDNRWYHHLKMLKCNKHHNFYLQKAYNENLNNFDFSIIEITTLDELINREQYYLDLYSSYVRKNGYNISSIAGRVDFSEEIRNKISEKLKGRIVSEETKQKLSLINCGRKMSNDFCLKVSKSLTGRKFSEEHKQNLSKSLSNSNILKSFQEKRRLTFELKHGTINCYRYHKCRCDLCRDIQNKSLKVYRHKKKLLQTNNKVCNQSL